MKANAPEKLWIDPATDLPKLSDYRNDDGTAKYYRDFEVTGYSFYPRTEKNVDITIEITPS